MYNTISTSTSFCPSGSCVRKFVPCPIPAAVSQKSIINKTEYYSLLLGSVTFIKETPDRRFCCLPHVPDPRTDQSPGLLQILGKYSCLFILILWLYPVVMEVLRSVKSETGKISLRPRVKIAQSPHLALRASWGDWLVFTLGLREIFQSPISQT